MSIRVHYDNVKFRLKKSGEIKRFLEKVIREEDRIQGDLDFIFTDDSEILIINKKFLSHNYMTDVISFGYGEGKTITGEIYISCETVKRNAELYKVSFTEEVYRVMIHGLLHLCGYGDETDRDREEMTAQQEDWLKKFKEEAL